MADKDVRNVGCLHMNIYHVQTSMVHKPI